jgi:hypothetical protein
VGGANATGNYRLTVDFETSDESVPTLLQSGQIGSSTAPGPTPASSSASAVGTLVIGENLLYQFTLESTPASGGMSAPLTVTITNAAGKVVLSLSEKAGQLAVTGSVYLPPGTYTITISGTGPSNKTSTPTNYWLSAQVGSQPIGTLATTAGSTLNAGSSSTTSGTTSPTSTSGSTTLSTSTKLTGYFYTF